MMQLVGNEEKKRIFRELRRFRLLPVSNQGGGFSSKKLHQAKDRTKTQNGSLVFLSSQSADKYEIKDLTSYQGHTCHAVREFPSVDVSISWEFVVCHCRNFARLKTTPSPFLV